MAMFVLIRYVSSPYELQLKRVRTTNLSQWQCLFWSVMWFLLRSFNFVSLAMLVLIRHVSSPYELQPKRVRTTTLRHWQCLFWSVMCFFYTSYNSASLTMLILISYVSSAYVLQLKRVRTTTSASMAMCVLIRDVLSPCEIQRMRQRQCSLRFMTCVLLTNYNVSVSGNVRSGPWSAFCSSRRRSSPRWLPERGWGTGRRCRSWRPASGCSPRRSE